MKNPNWFKCLICDDSKNILGRIPDNSVDLILTDPPYNLSPHSTGNIPLPGRTAINNDVAGWDRVAFNPEEWADEFVRILKPEGNLFIFTSYNQLGRWYDCLDHRFDSSNFMIWHKTNPVPKIFKAGFLNSCEMIFTCWNKRHTWNFLSQKEMHNFLESPICMRPERLSDPKHPTQKPVSILKKIITIASRTDDIVFDPFMGVGSTGEAALALGRKFIGVEIDRTYYEAARKRIERMATINSHPGTSPTDLAEPACTYGYVATTDTCPLLRPTPAAPAPSPRPAPALKPLLKWAGGKEKELKYILPNAPRAERYIEPFVGGGSVFAAFPAEQYFINDLSEELITLYRHIAGQDAQFFHYAEAIDRAWTQARTFFEQHPALIELYLTHRHDTADTAPLKAAVAHFCRTHEDAIKAMVCPEPAFAAEVLLSETEKNLMRKMARMRNLEIQKHALPEADLRDNIETAIKSALYMHFRHLYNTVGTAASASALHSALFLFMRNYAYSGMFRYNDRGAFNVPYGGIGYNAKSLRKKLDYYRSPALSERFSRTQIFNTDFEPFLHHVAPRPDDFIFLDPPYDSEFSTYAKNEFTQADHQRLAHYLLNDCPARWMMIIKNTEFIHGLYDRPGVNIRTFDKEYLVSFMNRNDKKVTHLLLTNY